MATGAAMRTWVDYTSWMVGENARLKREADLKDADDSGYARARGQFSGEILDLRDALKHERALSFVAHMDNVLMAREQQGKTFGFSTWRMWTQSQAVQGDSSKAKSELAQLRTQLSSSEAASQQYLSKVSILEKELRTLREDKHASEDDYFTRVRNFERDLEQLRREKENQLEKLILDNKHLQTSLDQSRIANEAQTEEHAIALQRACVGHDRLIADKSDAEQSVQNLSSAQALSAQKQRDLITDYEAKKGELETALQLATASENRAKRENEVVMRTLDSVHGELAAAKANAHTLEDRLADQGMEVERYVGEQRRVIQRLKAAEEALAVFEAGGAKSDDNNIGAIRQEINATRESLRDH